MFKNIFIVYLIVLFSFSVLGIAQISEETIKEYENYKSIVDANPEDPWAHFNLAITYAYMGKIEKGLSSLEKVDSLDNSFADKVISKFSELIQEKPEDWRIRFRLAFAYYFAKDKDNALKELQEVATMLPIGAKNAWAYGYMAVMYGEQKKWDKAVEYCRKGLAIEPKAAAIHFALAQALKETGDFLGAAAELFTASRLRAEEMKYERLNGISY